MVCAQYDVVCMCDSKIGKIAWRLKKFEEAKAKQDAEAEAHRIEAQLKSREERHSRKLKRQDSMKTKGKVMNVLNVIKNPDVLFR